MEITGPTINFNLSLPDNKKNVGMKISGGMDSAIILYMLSYYVKHERPDIKIYPITTLLETRPFQIKYSTIVINFMKEKFGNEIFGPHSTNSAKDIDVYVHSQDTLLTEAYEKYNLDCHFSGLTSNPPTSEVPAPKGQDPGRVRSLGDRIPKKISKKILLNGNQGIAILPLVDYHKKQVKEFYDYFNIFEELFPITYSCEEVGHSIDYHCGHCWQCKERFWGAGNRLV